MNKNFRRKQSRAGILFVLPGLLGVLVFYLIPFLDVIRRSFYTAAGNQFSGIKNYRIVFENKAFRLAAANTLRFTAVCIPLLLLLSFLTAFLLQRAKGMAQILKSSYLIPLAVPAASIVLLWRLMFDRQGMVNGILDMFGLKGQDWMNTGAAFGVLVFSYIWKNLGYDVVLWLAGLNSISETIYEAARVDGAGEWDCFRRITLPCIRPVAFVTVVISFLNSFKVFREAYLVTGNYPADEIYLLQHLFNNWFRDLSIDKMAAGAVLLALVVSVFVFMLQRGWDREE